MTHAWQVHTRAGTAARGRLFGAIVALALGVGLGFATHLVNQAALTAFAGGLRALAGGADVTIVGPRSGFAHELYSRLAARPEVAAASPIVEFDLRLLDPVPASPARSSWRRW